MKRRRDVRIRNDVGTSAYIFACGFSSAQKNMHDSLRCPHRYLHAAFLPHEKKYENSHIYNDRTWCGIVRIYQLWAHHIWTQNGCPHIFYMWTCSQKIMHISCVSAWIFYANFFQYKNSAYYFVRISARIFFFFVDSCSYKLIMVISMHLFWEAGCYRCWDIRVQFFSFRIKNNAALRIFISIVIIIRTH